MKKVFVILCFAVLSLLGTQRIFAQSSRTIDEHFKALNSHDIKAIAAGYAADAQVFSPNWEGAKAGPDSIAEAYRRYYKTSPDLIYTIVNTITTGNSVIVEYSWTGTMSDPEQGEPEYMRGKKYTLKACTIFILRDNKIAKETDYFDQVAFLRQVGFFDQNH
ncbi:MAG TPA: nuclear transport factor 2 family protein [Mucilaginibacter sp.]|jgi:steroid delta-isomerase-like uncharacterized protein|nr:nuclear transport factor 2 family protein [Mucilaginibacter sp.]